MTYLDILVTVQEGGTWLPAKFAGDVESLVKALKDVNNWIHSNHHGATATWTILPMSVQGGMSTMIAFHSLKLPDDTIWDSHLRRFEQNG